MNNTQTTTAVPNQQGTPPTQSLIGSFAPILIMILAFYFLMIRPQQKREAKKREMLSHLKRGDKVVTASGIIGTIHKVVNNDEISFEIAEGVRIRILKSAIVNLLDKDSPLGKDSTEENSDKKSADKKADKKSADKSGKKVTKSSEKIKEKK